jgi:hypothetical protein
MIPVAPVGDPLRFANARRGHPEQGGFAFIHSTASRALWSRDCMGSESRRTPSRRGLAIPARHEAHPIR